MDFKKITLILILFSVFVCTGYASGDFNAHEMLNITESFDKDTNITFEGIDFQIPEGYAKLNEINSDDESFLNLDNEIKLSSYVDEGGNIIVIGVVSSILGVSFDDFNIDNGTEVTINGHEGILEKDDDGYYFYYIEDNTGVIIEVGDKSLIKEVVI